MIDSKSILNLIGDVYESSINPDHWKVVMEKLAAITRSRSAVLVIHDTEVKQLSYLHAYGLPKLLVNLFNTPMGSIDPGLKIMRQQPAGKAVNMFQLDDRINVPIMFKAVFTRFSDVFYFGGINFFNDKSWHAGIGLHRVRQEGAFEPEMLELLEDLVPHFQRALRIQKEFTRLQLRQQMLQLELDRNVIGVVILGEEADPLYINPLAKRILERHRAIKMCNNSLCAYNRDDDEQLQQAIRSALTSPATPDQGHAIGLNHPEHATPLALLVVPTTPGNFAELSVVGHPKVAVYLTDPEVPAPIAIDTLIKVYNLTEREAKVAIAIANGRDVNEIAEMHHVSVQTVRSQLKSIFNKTGVNRQADLIRLLLGGPMIYKTCNATDSHSRNE